LGFQTGFQKQTVSKIIYNGCNVLLFMYTLLWIFLACFVNTLASFAGIFAMLASKHRIKSIVYFLVALSAGSLLGGAFFHLIPEALESLSETFVFGLVLTGFVVFYIAERFLHWHHCHEGVCKVHPYTSLILFGDGLHNFIDGLVIAASFSISVPFGLVTTLLILSHEVPQELGDFGVLVHGGMKPRKALLLNALSQATCFAGGILGFAFALLSEFTAFVLPFAAGGFIYIASSDLVPELHKEPSRSKSLWSMVLFLLGIALLLAIKLVFHH
jgi:zinc and cadmium transporter